MDKLRRGYGHLTVSERIDLLLAAQERDDFSEVEALDTSCPGADLPDYLTHLLALGSAASLLVVQLLASEILLLGRLADLGQAAGPDPTQDAPLLALLRRQAALWRGFVAYCRDLGHDPRQVLRMAPLGKDDDEPASFIIQGQLERLESWSDDLPLDPGQVQIWRDLFTRAFSMQKGS